MHETVRKSCFQFLNYFVRAAELDEKTVSILQNILVWIYLIRKCIKQKFECSIHKYHFSFNLCGIFTVQIS